MPMVRDVSSEKTRRLPWTSRRLGGFPKPPAADLPMIEPASDLLNTQPPRPLAATVDKEGKRRRPFFCAQFNRDNLSSHFSQRARIGLLFRRWRLLGGGCAHDDDGLGGGITDALPQGREEDQQQREKQARIDDAEDVSNHKRPSRRRGS